MFSRSLAVVALALTLVTTNAQDLTQLPACAQTPAISSIGSTGCQITDFACVCKDTKFIDSLTPQIQKACSAADFQKTLAFAQSLCSSVGVTLSVSGATAATSSAAAPMGSTQTTAVSSGTMTSSPATGGTTAATTIATTSATTAAAAATSSGAAAGSLAAMMEGRLARAMGVLGVVAVVLRG